MEIKHYVSAYFAALASPTSILLLLGLTLLWKVIDNFWLRPVKLEKFMRKQGFEGNSYKPFIGDIIEIIKPTKQPVSQPNNFDGPLPGITAFCDRAVQKHGKISFVWFGPTPCLIITVPEMIKEILNKYEVFQKPNYPFNKLLVVGLFGQEGHKWVKHRRILNPAFHMERLKNMVGAMYESCCETINAWEDILSHKESSDFDVQPFIESLTADVISRAAFGSSYEQGRRIFDLLKEQVNLMMPSLTSGNYIPGWRFLPTKTNKRAKEICRELEALLTRVIDSRKQELEGGASSKDNLLDRLLESNMKEIKEHGNEKACGLTTKEVVQECKLFYLAGQETTSSLLVWSLILLSKHQNWQEQARVEIFQVFGKDNVLDFEGLNHLKVLTMIIYEVLRLYSPAYAIMRKVYKDIQFKNWSIPKGTEFLMPVSVVQQDCDLWGVDAKTFNPERFSEGVFKATKAQGAFVPFSTGPRVCIGQNFSLVEAKLVLAMMLRRFSFELSPSYVHVPYAGFFSRPEYGANLILHKL